MRRHLSSGDVKHDEERSEGQELMRSNKGEQLGESNHAETISPTCSLLKL